MNFLAVENDFHQLSLRDLLVARDLYHVHLMHKENVVATAIGKYLIRKDDDWLKKGQPLIPRKGGQRPARTLQNSEVRDYSWPCILVFVEKWKKEKDLINRPTTEIVPSALHLPDGRSVPVCVVEAQRQQYRNNGAGPDVIYPRNLIGGGFPLLQESQGQQRIASVGCVVTDGHNYYALTNKHVAGDDGESVFSKLGDEIEEIGASSALSLGRLPFEQVYREWPGKNVYVNLDVGLITINNLKMWKTDIVGLGTLGRLADVSIHNLSLRLIGCPVRAHGAVSGPLEGEIVALFYRYRSVGGTDYVSDFVIAGRDGKPLASKPGDSGTVWVMESRDEQTRNVELRPIGIQWGQHTYLSNNGETAHPYLLATWLSTACNQLNVDLVRDWNIDLGYTWGKIGHYTVGTKAIDAINGTGFPKLRKLMRANLENISYRQEDLTPDITKLRNLPFYPLADVPDLVWKAKDGAAGPGRSPWENPNHYADIDYVRPSDGQTLLKLCQDPNNLDLQVWKDFYKSVGHTSSSSRGLLPFRVWQLHNGMVNYLKAKNLAGFVFAAGVLTHYVGDACQPLHSSYMNDGDPNDMITRPGKKNGQPVMITEMAAKGIHHVYEDELINDYIDEILAGIDQELPNLTLPALNIASSKDAGYATFKLMEYAQKTIPPVDLCRKYKEVKPLSSAKETEALWEEFGEETTHLFAVGCWFLARIWESAWALSGMNSKIASSKLVEIEKQDLIDLYLDPANMRSKTLNQMTNNDLGI